MKKTITLTVLNIILIVRMMPAQEPVLYSTAADTIYSGVTIDSIIVDPCAGVLLPKQKQAISIHPNPSQETFTISAQFAETTTIDIKINSLLGKTVCKETDLIAGDNFFHVIRLQNPNPGLYIVMVHGDSINEMRKIVIQ
jgi:hypothetical protein